MDELHHAGAEAIDRVVEAMHMDNVSGFLFKILAGEPKVECAYVMSNITDLPYFTSKVKFGKTGVGAVLPVGELNEYEQKRLEEAKAQLKIEIEAGLNYAKTNDLNF